MKKTKQDREKSKDIRNTKASKQQKGVKDRERKREREREREIERERERERDRERERELPQLSSHPLGQSCSQSSVIQCLCEELHIEDAYSEVWLCHCLSQTRQSVGWSGSRPGWCKTDLLASCDLNCWIAAGRMNSLATTAQWRSDPGNHPLSLCGLEYYEVILKEMFFLFISFLKSTVLQSKMQLYAHSPFCMSAGPSKQQLSRRSLCHARFSMKLSNQPISGQAFADRLAATCNYLSTELSRHAALHCQGFLNFVQGGCLERLSATLSRYHGSELHLHLRGLSLRVS